MLWELVSGEGIFGTKSKEADNGKMWEFFLWSDFQTGTSEKLEV